MKNQKKTHVKILCFCLMVISIFSYSYFYKQYQKALIELSEPQIEFQSFYQNIPQIKSQIKTPIDSSLLVSSVTNKTIQVTLNILDKKYITSLDEGASVYDAMNKIQSNKENNFSFQIKDYSDLGYFIEGINKVMGTPGKYWIYYVNDKKASVGISKYILNDGDLINWKQEGV